MNRNTVSEECLEGICSQCGWDSCACECHLEDDMYDAADNALTERYDAGEDL
jgi:hypothetical protein